MRQMQFQRCPNCRERNDVSVYVQGQLARCVRCSLRFTVERPVDPGAGELPTDVPELRNGPAEPGPREPTPAPVAPPPVPITSGQLFPTPAERPNVPARPPEAKPNQPDGPPNIPGYECIELLGRGGMGEVWRARQISLDRPVAIKILSPTLAVEPDFIRRFERESSALAALAHPHVVAVYDRGSANGHWYFVMEFVEGRSLRERAADEKAQRKDLLRLLAQVARAMEYAHRKRVIHRDLKPENVLIDHVGNAKVADFGLAGMSEIGRSSLTMTAVAMGTAHYMAPEQRRDAKNVDGRADLYSLGVMLYEMLCAEVPAGRFPSPREKIPDLDPRLDALTMRLLDQDPERRPSSATEVAELLERIVAGDKVPDRVVPVPIPRTQSWSAVIRDMKSFSPAQKSMLAGAAVLFVAIVAVAIARGGTGGTGGTGGKTRQTFSAKLVKSDKGATPGTRTEQIVIGAPGVENAILAIGRGWNVKNQELIRAAEPPANANAQAPRAYLMPLRVNFENAAIEADVTMEGISSGAKADRAPMAEVLLYRDRQRHVGVRLTPTAAVASTLFFAPSNRGHVVLASSDPRDKASSGSRQYHVELWMMNGHATASIDHHQVASAQITGLSGVQAKIALVCENVRCLFSHVKVTGQISDVSLDDGERP